MDTSDDMRQGEITVMARLMNNYSSLDEPVRNGRREVVIGDSKGNDVPFELRRIL